MVPPDDSEGYSDENQDEGVDMEDDEAQDVDGGRNLAIETEELRQMRNLVQQ